MSSEVDAEGQLNIALNQSGIAGAFYVMWTPPLLNYSLIGTPKPSSGGATPLRVTLQTDANYNQSAQTTDDTLLASLGQKLQVARAVVVSGMEPNDTEFRLRLQLSPQHLPDVVKARMDGNGHLCLLCDVIFHAQTSARDVTIIDPGRNNIMPTRPLHHRTGAPESLTFVGYLPVLLPPGAESSKHGGSHTNQMDAVAYISTQTFTKNEGLVPLRTHKLEWKDMDSVTARSTSTFQLLSSNTMKSDLERASLQDSSAQISMVLFHNALKAHSSGIPLLPPNIFLSERLAEEIKAHVLARLQNTPSPVKNVAADRVARARMQLWLEGLAAASSSAEALYNSLVEPELAHFHADHFAKSKALYEMKNGRPPA